MNWWLHGTQAVTTVSQLCFPPRNQGITWSRVSSRTSFPKGLVKEIVAPGDFPAGKTADEERGLHQMKEANNTRDGEAGGRSLQPTESVSKHLGLFMEQ